MTDTIETLQKTMAAEVNSELPVAWLVTAAILGALGHFVKKANRLRNQTWDEGLEFKWRDYLRRESLTITMSLICITIATIANEEVSRLHIAGVMAGDYLVIVFAALGWMSDSLMDWVFGGYEKVLKMRVREKVNDEKKRTGNG